MGKTKLQKAYAVGWHRGKKTGFKKAKIVGQRKLRHKKIYYTDRPLYEQQREQRRNKR